jgi:hypothetical protein
MGKCKSELYLVLTLCASELDLNNSLFLTTKNHKISIFRLERQDFHIFKQLMTGIHIFTTGT